MNSKPLSSLNHFAVPVAIWFLPGGCVRRNAGGAKATTTNAGTGLPGRIARHERTSLAAEGVCDRDLVAGSAAAHQLRPSDGWKVRLGDEEDPHRAELSPAARQNV